jgi:hypothetical protein
MAQALKDKEVAGTQPADQAQDAPTHNPIWTALSGRVQGAIWKHPQKGKSRYTIAISRSYRDQKNGEWKSVHFFDRQDLADVKRVRDDAESYLASVVGQAKPA